MFGSFLKTALVFTMYAINLYLASIGNMQNSSRRSLMISTLVCSCYVLYQVGRLTDPFSRRRMRLTHTTTLRLATPREALSSPSSPAQFPREWSSGVASWVSSKFSDVAYSVILDAKAPGVDDSGPSGLQLATLGTCSQPASTAPR